MGMVEWRFRWLEASLNTRLEVREKLRKFELILVEENHENLENK